MKKPFGVLGTLVALTIVLTTLACDKPSTQAQVRTVWQSRLAFKPAKLKAVGPYIAAVSDREEVLLYDQEGKLQLRFATRGRPLDISFNGRRFALSSSDGSRVWLRTYESMGTLLGDLSIPVAGAVAVPVFIDSRNEIHAVASPEQGGATYILSGRKRVVTALAYPVLGYDCQINTARDLISLVDHKGTRPTGITLGLERGRPAFRVRTKSLTTSRFLGTNVLLNIHRDGVSTSKWPDPKKTSPLARASHISNVQVLHGNRLLAYSYRTEQMGDGRIISVTSIYVIDRAGKKLFFKTLRSTDFYNVVADEKATKIAAIPAVGGYSRVFSLTNGRERLIRVNAISGVLVDHGLVLATKDRLVLVKI